MNFRSFFTISGNDFSFKTEPKMLGTPNAVHPRGHRGTDKQALGSRRPHPSAGLSPGGADRRDLRPGQGHHDDHNHPTNPKVCARWPEELGRPATAVHGGAAARVVAGEAFPAMTR
jgi:hypothetical protein